MINIAQDFLNKHPDLKRIEFIYADINGIPRGKWTSPDALLGAFQGKLKIPLSSYVVDIWGESPDDIQGICAADEDGICIPVISSLATTNWSHEKTAQCLISTQNIDKTPTLFDPRNVLQEVLKKFKKLGLRPVMASEMEFYLIDKNLSADGHPQTVKIPGTNKRYENIQLFSLDEMSDFEDFFNLVKESTNAMNIDIDAAVKEYGPSQFEINLLHHDDAILMADQIFLLKRAIKNCAKKFDMNATFMAKPFSNQAGNGMHVHLSLINEQGENVFTMKNNKPNGIFAKSIAGLLDSAPDFLSFYAPHANSYRRLVADCESAPTTISWGHENRTALIRIPESSDSATRLEFRAASADSNPYLVLASILAGILHGIDNNLKLQNETLGDAHKQHAHALSIPWKQALQQTSDSKIVEKYLTKKFKDSYVRVKEVEIKKFETTVTDFEYQSYLRCI